MSLYRYMIKNYVLVFTVILFALVTVISVSMLVEDVRHMNNSDSAGITMLSILAFQALLFAYQLLPIAAFLGALVWGALCARRGEFVALYVGGYSPIKLGMPFIVTAIVLSGITFMFGEYVTPWASNSLIRIRNQELFGKTTTEMKANQRSTWYRSDDFVLYLPEVDFQQEVFQKPQILKRSVQGEITDWWQAHSMTYQDSMWTLHHGWHAVFPKQGFVERQVFASMTIPIHASLQDLLVVSGKPEQLRFFDLQESIERRERTGRNNRFFKYQLHQRFVYPLSLLILVIISLPLALLPARTRTISGTLGSGSAVAGIAYSSTYLFQSMVASGSIAPWSGAWNSLLFTVTLSLLIYLGIRRVFDLRF